MARFGKQKAVQAEGAAPSPSQPRGEGPLFVGSAVQFVFNTLTAIADGKSVKPDHITFTKRLLTHALLSSKRMCWGEFQLPGVAPTALRISHNPPLQQELLKATGVDFKTVGAQIVQHWPESAANVFDSLVQPYQRPKLRQLVKGRRRMDTAQALATFLGTDVPVVEAKLHQARMELIDKVTPNFALTAACARGILANWRLPEQPPLSAEDREMTHALFIMKDADNPSATKPKPVYG